MVTECRFVLPVPENGSKGNITIHLDFIAWQNGNITSFTSPVQEDLPVCFILQVLSFKNVSKGSACIVMIILRGSTCAFSGRIVHLEFFGADVIRIQLDCTLNLSIKVPKLKRRSVLFSPSSPFHISWKRNFLIRLSFKHNISVNVFDCRKL